MAGFKAVMVSRDENKKQSVEIVELDRSDLMPGNVLVKIEHSTINYKDGLAITGKSPVIRRWPMIPGIDFTGTVIESSHAGFQSGDDVILNGWGVGEKHYGAFAGEARVNGDWLIKRPKGLSSAQCMAIGTAGYTAMLCVIALENAGVTPGRGPILVTGANGGVGTIAISLLSTLGYHVVASTGRLEEEGFLTELGASEVLDRKHLSEPGRPLGNEVWSAAIDSVGSHTLANVLSQIQYGGAVAACGLAQGYDLPSTVMPFILRGISLLGIDSVMKHRHFREAAWARLEADLDLKKLEALSTTIGFGDIVETAEALMAGKIRGRVIVDINAA